MAPTTSKDTPPPSDVGPQAGVSMTPMPALGGAAERVISIPSDKEEEASVVQVEEAIRQLLALRAKSFEIVDLTSSEVRSAVEERDRRLNETMSLEARLSAELEQVKAEGERVAYEQQKADNHFSRMSSEIAKLKQVIADAQASLATQEKAREQLAMELEDIESRRQSVIGSVEEKDQALKQARDTIQDLVSRTEEDFCQEILMNLELHYAREIREPELRLRAL
ncbi:uncharacterized protein At1g10890-like [Asparagus officinalis]|uniref:uncharacterized protein At1g10890-like n=1 Tax=Asparagus officinalis TaxID=4686 RepID=UPI00098E7413|nr:uncharacterized protein At1g10890-like [Asparagus officinalis]